MSEIFCSIKEFAVRLKISESTVRRAISNKRIRAIRIGSSKRAAFRIPLSEIERIGMVDLQEIIKKMVDEEVKKLIENK